MSLTNKILIGVAVALVVGVIVYFVWFRNIKSVAAANPEDQKCFDDLIGILEKEYTGAGEGELLAQAKANYESQNIAANYKGSKSGALMATIDAWHGSFKDAGKASFISDALHEQLWSRWGAYTAMANKKF